MGLLNWLKQGAQDVGNFAAGVERQINPFDGGATFSNPNPAPAPAPAPQHPSFLQGLANGFSQIPNIRLGGLEQGWNMLHPGQTSAPITIGSVVPHIPVVGQAAQFAFHTPPAQQTLPNFIGGIFKTGVSNAQYAAPELDIFKAAPEAGLAARALVRGANLGLPAAGLNITSQLAQGQHDPLKIAQAAGTGLVAGGAFGAANELVPAALHAAAPVVRAAADSAEGAIARNLPEIMDSGAQLTQNPALTATMGLHPQAVPVMAIGRMKPVEPAEGEFDPLAALKQEAPANPHNGMPTHEAPNTPIRTHAGTKYLRQDLTDLYNQAHAEATGRDLGAGEAQPPVPPAKTPPAAPQPVKQRGFVTSVKNSTELSPETQAKVSGNYTPKSNAELAANAEQFASGDLNQATQQLHEALNAAPGKVSDQTVANAIALAKRHDAAGNFEQASSILDKLAEHGTESGRQVQAYTLLGTRTPQGMLYSAQKTLKKAGVDLTDDLKGKLQSALDEVKSTKYGTPERDFALQKFVRVVNRAIPSSNVDKAIGLWKAGLLTGIRTQTGNALSNVANISLRKASDPLAAGLDKGASLITGQRTKTLTMTGLGSGAREGLSAAKQYMKTGIDERNLANAKFDTKSLVYGNGPLGKAAQAYTDSIFKLMGAADRPYYYATLRNTLADLGKADGLNQGFSGKALANHVNQFVKEPPAAAFQTATQEAEKSVFANETALSRFATGIRQGASSNPVMNAAVNIIAPFTRVPSSVITQVFDYTPVGALKEVITQAYKHQLDQRALVEALSKATTGTIGVISTGAALAKAGLLTGAYPNDPKEQARWKAEGRQPNSILIGGKWRSLNYVSPFGPLLGMGQNVADAAKQGAGLLGQISAAASGGAQTALGQSFLQGVQGVLDAVNDPQRYAQSFVKNQAGSIIPTLSNDIAKATDPMQRTASGVAATIQSRIPGLRESLPVATDAFGNPLKRATGTAGTLTDPLRSTTALSTPLTNELDRLDAAGQSIFPTPDKTLTVGKQSIKLNPAQQQTYNTAVGQATQAIWNQIIAAPEYKALPDDQKKQALQAAEDDARAVQKAKFLAQAGQTTAAQQVVKGMSKRQLAIYGGSQPQTTDYTLAGAKPGNPKEAYQLALAKYQSDKTAGRLSASADFNTQQKLGRMKIEAQYDQPVLDMYGMSKTKLSAFLAAHPDQQKYLGQVFQLDDQLAAAGFTAKPKFGGTTAKKSSGGSRKSGTASSFSKVSLSNPYHLADLSSLHSLLASTKVKPIGTTKFNAPKAPKVPVMHVTKKGKIT